MWWDISTNEGHHIELTFTTLEIKNPFGSCSNDYVNVYTDVSNTGISEKYCDDHKPTATISSAGRRMLVNFVTDDFYSNKRGFEAKYSVVNEAGEPIVPITTTAPDSDDYYDYDEDESTKSSSTTTTTTTTAASTTTTTTIKPKTASTRKPQKTTTVIPSIMSKRPKPVSTHSSSEDSTVSETTTVVPHDDRSGGLVSGIIFAVIGVGLIIVACLIFRIFIRWRREKHSRFISLRDNQSDEFNTDDTKELVDQPPTIYKKQKGSTFVQIPQQENFPL